MARHLTLEERDRIAQLQYQGADQKEIARAVGRCPSTISRELRRNGTDDKYYAAQAQREAERRRQECLLVGKMEDPEINEAVRAGMALAKATQAGQAALRRRPRLSDGESGRWGDGESGRCRPQRAKARQT
jgi:IS30 family transposase